MTSMYVLEEQPDLETQIEASRLRAAAESACRVAALVLAGGLNILGWMVVFEGPWRIGLWIVVLSAELLAVVLWDSGTSRTG